MPQNSGKILVFKQSQGNIRKFCLLKNMQKNPNSCGKRSVYLLVNFDTATNPTEKTNPKG